MTIVFSTPTHVHIAYQIRQVPYFFKRYILRRNIAKEQLYVVDDDHDKSEDRPAV